MKAVFKLHGSHVIAWSITAVAVTALREPEQLRSCEVTTLQTWFIAA